jgi:hypothetical protein
MGPVQGGSSFSLHRRLTRQPTTHQKNSASPLKLFFGFFIFLPSS